MRLPILSFMRFQSQAMTTQLDRFAALQEQGTNGKKIQKSSENPLLAERTKSINSYIEQMKGFEHNLNLAQSRLNQKASVATEAINLMGNVKELLLKAQNGTLNEKDREVIAVEVNGILNRTLDLANSRDSDGSYIFSGHKIYTPPFIQVQGKYIYQGSDDIVQTSIGLNNKIQYAEPGSTVFATSGSGDNIFNVLSEMVTLLQTPPQNPQDHENRISRLDDIAVQLEGLTQNFIAYETSIGNQSQVVHNQKLLSDNLILDQTKVLSGLEDADLTQVATDIAQQQLLLGFTQDTYMKLHETFRSMLTNR